MATRQHHQDQISGDDEAQRTPLRWHHRQPATPSTGTRQRPITHAPRHQTANPARPETGAGGRASSNIPTSPGLGSPLAKTPASGSATRYPARHLLQVLAVVISKAGQQPPLLPPRDR